MIKFRNRHRDASGGGGGGGAHVGRGLAAIKVVAVGVVHERPLVLI